MLIPLQSLIDDLRGQKDALMRVLLTFRCEQDEDIEKFLHDPKKAVGFEEAMKSRTYLIVDEEVLAKRNISEITVLGYFTLSSKVLKLPENLSNNKRKSLDGFSAKAKGRPITEIPCVLIGQLGRNSSVDRDSCPGDYLVQAAEDIVRTATDAIGGRITLIEAKANQKVIDCYLRNGYTIFQEEDNMIQLIKNNAEA